MYVSTISKLYLIQFEQTLELVATNLNNNAVTELVFLSNLHGIGAPLLHKESLHDNQIIYQEFERQVVDWQPVIRLTIENKDFHRYLGQLVSMPHRVI